MSKLAYLFCALAFAQDTAAPRVFEVAEIKINKTKGPLAAQFLPSGQVILRNITVRQMIMSAWGVREFAVIGGPSWLDSERFDVVAKAAPHITPDEYRPMLQALLAERFQLVVHSDQKQLPAYALTIGSQGAKLKPADPASTDAPGCSGGRVNGAAHRACHALTLGSFVQALPGFAPNYIDRPIIDATGLKGLFDYTLDWTPRISC